MLRKCRILLLVATLAAGCSAGVLGGGESGEAGGSDDSIGAGPDAGAPDDCAGDPCDLLDQCGCGENEACGLDSSGYATADTMCHAVTTRGIAGDECTSDADCAPGLGCFGECRRFCDRDDQCGENSFCIVQVVYDDGTGNQPIPDTRICSTVCKPDGKTNNGCPTGQACDIYAYQDITYTACRAAGTGGEGDDCDAEADCRAGFSCVAFSDAYRVCTQICEVIGDDPYTAPPTCDGSGICRGEGGEDWQLGDTEYGSCAP